MVWSRKHNHHNHKKQRCLHVHEEAYSSYGAKGLAKDKALELFCWNAFQQHHPKDDCMNLCDRTLHYAKGLPLALIVLGSFLFRRDKEEWESALDRLKTIPLDDIQKVLRISYDGVDDGCKKLLLDIACFFKDWGEKIVTRFHPKIELKVLDERCLISISDGFIRMHDSLQEMGWAIVRENYPKNPGNWSSIEEKYRSNQWTHFIGSFYYSQANVRGCGIHLIYTKDYERCIDPWMLQGNSSDHGNLGDRITSRR